MGQQEKTYGEAGDSSLWENLPANVPEEDRTAEEFMEDKSILSEDSFCPLDGYTHPIHR